MTAVDLSALKALAEKVKSDTTRISGGTSVTAVLVEARNLIDALLARVEEAEKAKADAWTEGYGAGFHNLADISDHFRAGGGIDTIRPPAQNPYNDRSEAP